APENLQQVQRGTLAVLRREIQTCKAPQFVDFLLRWQGVHPEARRSLHSGVREVLGRLQQQFLPMSLWEQTILPSRVPEYQGRWSLLPWSRPAQEEHAVRQAEVLLDRYGIVARELAQGEGWLPPWRVLYEVYSRMELAGSVRRGYFVEGLSGAQFATPQAARL